MNQTNAATKSIAVSELDPELQQLVREAGAGKIQLTIVDDGNPVAVIMPFQSARDWSEDRQRFFDTLREMQMTADLSPEEADELALEAVKAVRAQRG